jgi:hypothetical protein
MNDIMIGIDGMTLRTKICYANSCLVIYVPGKQADLFGLKKGTIVDVTIKKSEAKP